MPKKLPLNQQFQTPLEVCRWLVSYLNIPPFSTIFEPTPGSGNFIQALEERDFVDVERPQDNFFAHQFTKKYDLIIGNPPFSSQQRSSRSGVKGMALGYEIAELCFQQLTPTGKMVLILPWMYLINGEKRTDRVFPYLAEVIHLPRNTFPGIRTQTAIFIHHKQPTITTLLHSYTNMTMKPAPQLESYL